jgi:hypothetical protein
MVTKSEFIAFEKSSVTITSQGLQQNFELQQRCPNCGDNRTTLVKIPEGAAHYAMYSGQCERFLGWQVKPENQKMRRRQQAQITRLLESLQLNQLKREFLLVSPSRQPHLSKQQKILCQIGMSLGGQS